MVFRITVSQSTDEVLEVCDAWNPETAIAKKTAKFYEDGRQVDVVAYFLFSTEPVDKRKLAQTPNPAPAPPVERIRNLLEETDASEEEPDGEEPRARDKPSEALSLKHFFSP